MKKPTTSPSPDENKPSTRIGVLAGALASISVMALLEIGREERELVKKIDQTKSELQAIEDKVAQINQEMPEKVLKDVQKEMMSARRRVSHISYEIDSKELEITIHQRYAQAMNLDGTPEEIQAYRDKLLGQKAELEAQKTRAELNMALWDWGFSTLSKVDTFDLDNRLKSEKSDLLNHAGRLVDYGEALEWDLQRKGVPFPNFYIPVAHYNPNPEAGLEIEWEDDVAETDITPTGGFEPSTENLLPTEGYDNDLPTEGYDYLPTEGFESSGEMDDMTIDTDLGEMEYGTTGHEMEGSDTVA